MSKSSKTRGVRRAGRRGLAPLELVLALPLLLAVMALMVVYGNAAFWKVRGLSVARNAAWSNRWPRTGFDEPAPNPWTPGNYSRRAGNDIDVLDDPMLQHPVVRGPLGNFNVRSRLLDPSRGVIEGHAEAKIQPAMMPSLKPARFALEQTLVDDKFQYPQMGIPANVHRRIPYIYDLPKADASLSQAWVDAALAVLNAPFKPALRPLDRDDELFAHYGYYPDFHPRLSRFCSLDLSSAWDNETRRLIGRIKGRQRPRVQGVPERMASAWINMYQSQIDGWQSEINDLQNQINNLDPVTDAGLIAQLQMRIAELQSQIDALSPQLDILKAFREYVRGLPDTPDGPVPPLAAAARSAPQVAAAGSGTLQPIPASRLHSYADAWSACCGQSSLVEQLLEALDEKGSPNGLIE